jgi:lactam utilization protein B
MGYTKMNCEKCGCWSLADDVANSNYVNSNLCACECHTGVISIANTIEKRFETE